MSKSKCTTIEQTAAPDPTAGFLNEAQILERIPVSRRTLAVWKSDGQIPYVKIGNRCLYSWPAVEGALLRKQRNAMAA